MKKQGKLLKTAKATLSFILVSVSAMCVLQRLPECFGSQNPAALVAAAFTLTDGEYRLESDKKSEKSTEPTDESETKPNEDSTETASPKIRDKTGYYDSYAEHEGEEKYSIEEKNISGGATEVSNCYIKNKKGLDLDFEAILSDKLTFSVKMNTDSPQVLIYHTHTSEAYMDEDVDYFYESFYSRTQNSDFNVVGVGEAIAETLNKKGIKTLHDKTQHDYPEYTGSYTRAAKTINSYLKKYPSIKIVLDLHRDAVSSGDSDKVKLVSKIDGRKAAQVMLVMGSQSGSVTNFPNWQENLKLAFKLQQALEVKYPSLARPLSLVSKNYNESLTKGSMLIEFGTDANSMDEVKYSAELVGDALASVLNTLKE